LGWAEHTQRLGLCRRCGVMRLVLTSGFTGSEGSFHDWNYMLTQTGLDRFDKNCRGHYP
jgi:hypothetical protein